MNWVGIASIILNVAYIGLSGYAASNPEVVWIAPIVTILASITKTPQNAAKDTKFVSNFIKK